MYGHRLAFLRGNSCANPECLGPGEGPARSLSLVSGSGLPAGFWECSVNSDGGALGLSHRGGLRCPELCNLTVPCMWALGQPGDLAVSASFLWPRVWGNTQEFPRKHLSHDVKLGQEGEAGGGSAVQAAGGCRPGWALAVCPAQFSDHWSGEGGTWSWVRGLCSN